MKTKIFTRITTFILALLIVFYAVPGVVYTEAAEAIGNIELGNNSNSESVSASENTEQSDAVPLYEEISLRDETSKTFKMSDGSFVAATYPKAIHRLDEDGKLQDIDNSLSVLGSEIGTKDSRIKFAKKITGNETLFTLKEGNEKITFSLIGAKKKTVGKIASQKSDDSIEDELGKFTTLNNLSSSIVYKDILNGVDVEYILESNSVKENIIVKERLDSYSFSFEIKLNNLTAILDESGSIRIIDQQGQTVYAIPAPIIYDSQNSYAEDGIGAYSLDDQGNGSYILTVSVDADWMNASERVYPITVDPTLDPTDSYVTFTYINDQSAAYSGPSVYNLYKDYSSSSESMLYWKMNSFSFIPDNAFVTDAKLRLRVENASADGYIGAHRLLNAFDSTSFSSNSSNIYYPTSYIKLVDESEKDYYDFDLTELVKLWHMASNYNHGIVLKYLRITGESNSYFANVYTYSAQSTVNKPLLTVSYINMMGIEDYFTYSTHSVGSASGSLNLANGNLTFVVPTLTTTDSLLPYTPSLVFNTGLANDFFIYPNAETAFSVSAFSTGFKWNFQQSVIEKRYTLNNSQYDCYIWVDADGTEHAFKADDDGKIVDEDGMQLVLTKSNDGQKITLTAKDKSTMEFTAMADYDDDLNGAWRLERIKDKIGNAVLFSYNSQGLPQYIELLPFGYTAGIRMLEIVYGAYNSPRYIFNSASGDAVIFRYSNTYNGSISANADEYLREIEYLKASSAGFTDWGSIQELQFSSYPYIDTVEKLSISYNSNGTISSVSEDVSGYRIAYQYNDNKGRIFTISEYGTTDAEGNASEGRYQIISYSLSYTTVTTSTNKSVTTQYVFDKRGRVQSRYTYSGDEIIGAALGAYETQENVKNNLSQTLTVGGSNVSYALNGGFERLDSNGNIAYWDTYGNVTRISGPDYDGEYKMQLGTNESSSISQALYLTQDDYSVSFDVQSTRAEGSSIKVTVKELYTSSGLSETPTVIAEKTFPIDANHPSAVSRVSLDFSVSLGIKMGNMVLICIEAVGNSDPVSKVYVDRVSVNRGSGAKDYSLVDAGHFEIPAVNANGGNSIPLTRFWVPYGQNYDFDVFNVPFSTSYRARATMDTNMLKQRVYSASSNVLALYDGGERGLQGKYDYVISAYARTYGAVNLPSHNANFRVGVAVGYYQGADNETVERTYYFDFLPRCTDWQFVSGSFSTLIEDDGADFDLVEYIDLICEYSNQPGVAAAFDNVSLTCVSDGSLQKYGYDDAGNLVSKSSPLYREYYGYDEENRLTFKANDHGELYTYEYNDEGLLDNDLYLNFTPCSYIQFLNSSDDEVTVTPILSRNYYYNEYGQPTRTVSRGEDDGTKMTVKYTYTTSERIFGARISEEDAAGVKIYYYYDQNDGRLLAEVNYDSGVGTAYSYDSLDRLVKVCPAYYLSSTEYITDVGLPIDDNIVYYEYNSENMLEYIVTDSTEYRFVYDSFGNSDEIYAGDNLLASYEYYPKNGNLKAVYYGTPNGNGVYPFAVNYEYNMLDLISEICYTKNGNKTLAYSYFYDEEGNISEIIDRISGEGRIYTYDTAGRLSSIVSYSSSDMEADLSEQYFYNDQNQISLISYMYDFGNTELNYLRSYTYLGSGNVGEVRLNILDKTSTISYLYDGLERLIGKNSAYKFGTANTFRISEVFEYKANGTGTTNRIESFTSTVNNSLSTEYDFTYDDEENITSITYNGKEIEYFYDGLGQIVRENNQHLGYTYIYEYDNAGNITSTKRYNYQSGSADPIGVYLEETYGYSDGAWGDLLTSYNGETITYDGIGNPLSYYNGTRYGFTWTGRSLTGATIGGNVYSFTYNEDGIRTSKTKNGLKTRYSLSGNLIMGEETGNAKMVYLYDDTNSPIGMLYTTDSGSDPTWSAFWFEKNLQGDIVAVYDQSGNKSVSYTYDAWGNFTTTYHNGASSIAAQNPFRYRGYYYDSDLGLYCVGVRYYDSITSRWISPDKFVSAGQGLLGCNIYSYCYNNPIQYIDFTGEFPWIVVFLVVTTIAGGLIGAFADVQPEAIQKESFHDPLEDGMPNIDDTQSEDVVSSLEDNNDEKTSTLDRIKNIAIGAGLGLAAGGAIVATGGVVYGALYGIGAAYFGVTAMQGMAIGALALDFSAFVVLPLFSIEIEAIEYETPTAPQIGYRRK